jgi:hypothetical protein
MITESLLIKERLAGRVGGTSENSLQIALPSGSTKHLLETEGLDELGSKGLCGNGLSKPSSRSSFLSEKEVWRAGDRFWGQEEQFGRNARWPRRWLAAPASGESRVEA